MAVAVASGGSMGARWLWTLMQVKGVVDVGIYIFPLTLNELFIRTKEESLEI